MILIYAFSNHWGTNISHRTLIELQNLPFFKGRSPEGERDFDFELIRNYPQEFFRKHIQGNFLPALSREGSGKGLIIGLGDYYGNISKIRIETQAKNAYNDKEIYPFSPIFLDLNLPNVDIYDSHDFKISSNMGTYNCNWLAYKTQLYLNQHSPQTYHLFLHLPPKSNASFLAENIKKLLIENNLF